MPELSRVQGQLASELLTLRNLAGLSQRALRDGAEKDGLAALSQSAISRAERAELLLDRRQTEAWLGVTGADEAARDRVLALTEAAHGETRSWSRLMEGVDHLQEVARARNDAATRVRNFQLAVVPGLLQTAEYARQVLAHVHADPAPAVAARLQRQQVLYETGRRFDFLIAERLLRPPVGPAVRAGQLHHLASLATLEVVSIGIVPEEVDTGLASHGFVIRDSAEAGDAYVTIELLHGEQVITDPEPVENYERAWDRLWESAVVDGAIERIMAGVSAGRGEV